LPPEAAVTMNQKQDKPANNGCNKQCPWLLEYITHFQSLIEVYHSNPQADYFALLCMKNGFTTDYRDVGNCQEKTLNSVKSESTESFFNRGIWISMI
jgi:hypothetical protein